MILMTGISTTTFTSQTQNGKPSDPFAVFLIFENALNTCVDYTDVAQVLIVLNTH